MIHNSGIITFDATNKEAKKLKVLREVKGVIRRDRVRNADVYEEFKITPIIETIQTGPLRWFGHVMRRYEKTATKKVLNLKVKDRGERREHPG